MKHKTLGLLLVVASVFALSAVSASAAAAAPLFHSEKEPVTFKGTSANNVFTTSAGTVECSTSTFEGVNATKTSTTATLAPTYSGCKAFGFLSATVEPHGCTYTFHLVEGSSPPTANVDVNCSGANEITISSTGCVVHVPAQTGLKHVVFSNEGSGTARDVKASVTIEGIKYTATSGCPGGAGVKTDGKYSGTVTVKGFTSSGVQQGIWVE